MYFLGVSLTLLGLLVLTIWLATTTHNRLHHVSASLEQVSNLLNSLSESITRVGNGISDLATRVEKDIFRICKNLDNRHGANSSTPIALTAFRERISRDLTVRDWADKLLSRLNLTNAI